MSAITQNPQRGAIQHTLSHRWPARQREAQISGFGGESIFHQPLIVLPHEYPEINGEPPQDVADYLGTLLDYAFPPDEETLVDPILGLIEIDLPPTEGDEPLSAYARRIWARRSGK